MTAAGEAPTASVRRVTAKASGRASASRIAASRRIRRSGGQPVGAAGDASERVGEYDKVRKVGYRQRAECIQIRSHGLHLGGNLVGNAEHRRHDQIVSPQGNLNRIALADQGEILQELPETKCIERFFIPSCSQLQGIIRRAASNQMRGLELSTTWLLISFTKERILDSCELAQLLNSCSWSMPSLPEASSRIMRSCLSAVFI